MSIIGYNDGEVGAAPRDHGIGSTSKRSIDGSNAPDFLQINRGGSVHQLIAGRNIGGRGKCSRDDTPARGRQEGVACIGQTAQRAREVERATGQVGIAIHPEKAGIPRAKEDVEGACVQGE